MGFVNIQNTNLENGVTNRNAADMFGSMAQLDPTRFHSYMEDFDYFHPLLDWDIVSVGGGTQALVDADGGVLRQTTGGADNDQEFLLKDEESFEIEAQQNRKMYYRTRLSLDDATESDLLAGLASPQPLTLTPDDGVFFRKDDDDAELDFVVRSGAAEIAADTNIATMTTNFTTLEWYWDGIDRIYYGVDGTPLGFLDLNGLTLPAGSLAPAQAIQAGQAAVLVADVDYIFVAKERD